MTNRETFSIYIEHGGRLVSVGNDKVYHGSEITSIHGLDSDRFGYLDLEDAVEKLGYVSWSNLLYKVPKTEVYKSLHNDKDVMEMLSHLSQKCRLFSIYVDKGNKARDMVENVIENPSIDGEASADAIENGRIENEDKSDKELVAYENEVGEGVESDYEPDNSDEDISYNPVGEENDTDDSLDDDELASDDDEYIQSRLNQRVSMQNIYESEVCTNNLMLCGEDAHGESSKAAAEAFVSDYEDSDVEMNSDSTEERDNMIRKPKKVTYDPKCNHKSLKLVVGMRFEDGFQCKHAIQTISIENGHPIRFTRFNKTQCEAKCIPECGWRCYGSLVKKDGTFVIKSLNGDHKCPREMNNKQATSEWIAREYLNKFRMRPNMSVKELELDIMSRFACEVTPWRLYKAKWKIQEKLRGSVSEHYGGLRRYIAELMKIDKEGRFELQLGDGSVFKALYIGFSSLRKGFLRGCRPIIGLDGCFLKTYLGGVLLCAIGKDGNNQMYPIAWAVVEVENGAYWTWFLTILFEELGIRDGLGYTLISDQQKGLINAVRELVPFAEHRNCARHIYCNWKKQFKGSTLKNMFWRAARATYVEAYKIAIEELKQENEAAYKNFIEREPQRFCKAFISTIPSCDMIDNNISETFNGFIVKAREKHLIDMLEDIHNALMERQYRKLTEISNVNDRLCPRIRKKVEKHKYDSRYCIALPALGGKFRVQLHEDRFVVNMRTRSCTCRAWDLSGIPCIHACSAIRFLKEDVADYVVDYYTISKYIECFRCGLEPINGKTMWPEAVGDPVQPPLMRKMPGRQKKKRRRAADENEPTKSKSARIFGITSRIE